jgi:hypothetical protein
MPNEVVLHINLRDPSNVRQQEVVGILGVNLIYAAHHAIKSADAFLASVFEDLDLQRLEIDSVEFSGPAIGHWNREESHALLVVGGYAEAVAFSADNQLAPPNELLYKRALVLAPGRFDKVSDLHASLIQNALAELPDEELKDSKGRLGLFCLSVASGPPDNKVSVREVVEHVVDLQRLGYGVMVFRAQELYRMSVFANRYTKSRIHFAIGLSVLLYVMEDSYQNLKGTLLEGIARLFAQNVRLSVYPMSAKELENRTRVGQFVGWRWKETDGMVSAENLLPAEPLDALYRYLIGTKFILPANLEKQ